ncbi:MAG: Flp pilus assembly protein CpaB [Acidobacteria bacterium]|nr:Flp pilus assembly protein CpaB [Acidobacteriota bacterium]MBI3282183.1 Flp pilus assembly protein CpaB [Acidobacteriota bacterium]
MDRKKILTIFGVAWASAVLLTWFVYSQVSGPRVEKTAVIMAAARDMPAGTRLRRNDLKRVRVPQSSLPKAAIFEDRFALDRVLVFPINTNEPIVSTKLARLTGAEGIPATIEPGMRAISVPISDASSAGGLIQPRARVDVLFTRTGSVREALTTTLLQDVVVLSIGKLTEAGQTVDPRAARSQQQTATLMVTPEDARKLELAKNHGKIGLVLRNPLDRSLLEDPNPMTASAIAPNLGAQAGRILRTGAPNIRDPKVWSELTGMPSPNAAPAAAAPKPEEKKPPAKPKHVVDVYKGDKHIQEIFQ